MTTSVQPRTSFNWAIYADATLAGLSVLIPIPFVDDFFEGIFRRRMLRSIARVHDRVLPESVQAELNNEDGSCVSSCLGLPVKATIGLIEKLSRKILYFLTIKRATDRLSYYWHRAFLIDYMLAAGHLQSPASARMARLAMEQVLQDTGGPLAQFAQQITGSVRHVWRTLRRARQGGEDETIQQTRAQMGQRWNDYAGYLRGVAQHYDELYRALAAAQPPAA